MILQLGASLKSTKATDSFFREQMIVPQNQEQHFFGTREELLPLLTFWNTVQS